MSDGNMYIYKDLAPANYDTLSLSMSLLYNSTIRLMVSIILPLPFCKSKVVSNISIKSLCLWIVGFVWNGSEEQIIVHANAYFIYTFVLLKAVCM